MKDPYSDSKGRHQYAATFAGFFPADTPEYSVICVLISCPTRETFYGGGYPAIAVKELVNNLEIH